MEEKNRCCGTCVHHKPFVDEFRCENGASEAYWLETQWNDYCEEWEETSDGN